jgi:hypothetical protein
MNQFPAHRDLDPDRFHEFYRRYCDPTARNDHPEDPMAILAINFNILRISTPGYVFRYWDDAEVPKRTFQQS